jgi:hypothetical protein
MKKSTTHYLSNNKNKLSDNASLSDEDNNDKGDIDNNDNDDENKDKSHDTKNSYIDDMQLYLTEELSEM